MVPRSVRGLKPDVWLTGHTDVYGRDGKLARSAKDGAAAWVDPDGYKKWVAVQKGKFEARVEQERVAP